MTAIWLSEVPLRVFHAIRFLNRNVMVGIASYVRDSGKPADVSRFNSCRDFSARFAIPFITQSPHRTGHTVECCKSQLRWPFGHPVSCSRGLLTLSIVTALSICQVHSGNFRLNAPRSLSRLRDFGSLSKMGRDLLAPLPYTLTADAEYFGC